MQLLIALCRICHQMSHTFAEVNILATEEWRLVFARLVKEYFDATVLPVPLNIFELVANIVMQADADAVRLRFEGGQRTLSWGQHYIWPAPSLEADIREAKAAQEAKHQRGGRNQT
jgi:hypothetical protein